MRWKIALGLALVFTGTGNITMGVTFGFLRFIDYPSAPGLVIAAYLSVIGVFALFLGKRAIARYPEYDLGPQICLVVVLGIVISIVITCCNIFLSQYGVIRELCKYVLLLAVYIWIAKLAWHLGVNEPISNKARE